MDTSLRQYRDLLSRYLKPQMGSVILMVTVLLLGIAIKLINPQVLRYFLDTAQGSVPARSLNLAAGLFLTFAILQQGLNLAAEYMAALVGWTSTNRLRADLTLHILRLDMPFHKLHTPGELIEWADGNVTQLSNFLSIFIVHVMGNGLLVVGILVFLFRENNWLGLGMLVYTLLTLLVLRAIQKVAVPRWAAERQASARLYSYIEERISGADEIRAAGAEAYVMRHLYEYMRDFTRKTRAAVVFSSLTYNLTNLVYVLGYAAGLAIGVFLYMRGEASLGTGYLITYYVGMLSDPLQGIRGQAEDFQQAAANMQRINELFQLRPRVGDPLPEATRNILPDGPLAVGFEGVSFHYDDNQKNNGSLADGPNETNGSGHANALSGVSFEIKPGRVLGILGRTGSGKSTLTRLLFRLYDPARGSVRLGGLDLRALQLDDLRRRVAMVTQDVQLFQATVRDNLTFFNRAIPDEQLEHVLKQLGLWQWAQSLPEGLATALAGGQSLSSGEAQLLAFTRVFLKDPGLVILDEASSRLDPATETLMERAVDRLLAERTGVVIAHRLKTVQRADDILILENGRVVEYGPRARLAVDPTSRFYHLLQTGLEEALA
ncbi:MAG TPA: ABC transporter ATP-binding protein [Anaerolineales bacterium]|nr:ABC transporter ATP-binding protein [Anaerolineales bacterium]